MYFAILLFFSLLLQEYNNNTMNILRRFCRIATFLMAFLSNSSFASELHTP